MEEEEIAADLVEAQKELERIEKQGGDTSEA